MAEGDIYGDLISAGFPAHWGMSFTKTIHKKPSPSIDPAKVTLPPGYTVVITGAGKGIGEYIAKAYALAKATNIIITSRTQSDLERVKAELESINPKANVIICPGDATKAESYQAIAKILQESYGGKLDCVVTNAGGGDMSGVNGPLHEAPLDVFTRVTELNYLGPFYGIMTLMPFLLKSTSKTIINIVSGAVHLVDLPPPSYNIAKLATVRMSEIITSLYAKEGVICFALHPGAVQTPGTRREIPGSLDFLTDDISLAGAVCVWLSNENPAWGSGRYISSTWDMGEFKARQEEIVQGDKLKFRMVV